MKKYIVLLMFLILFVSTSLAMGSAPKYGSELGEKQVERLRAKGYSKDDLAYLSLLSKKSGQNVDSVAAIKAKGGGWGVVAHKLGVAPGELNRLRTRLNKENKEQLKQQAKERERNRVRLNAPKPVKVKPLGTGRGRRK